MKTVNLKIQLDRLRLALDHAFINNGDIIQIKKLHFTIQKKEKEFIKSLPILN